MGRFTRLQIREYIRSITGVFDSDRINDETLNADINLAQTKLQLDLIPLGVKQFTKTAYGAGYIFTAPSDMLFHPNAIIDLEVTSGIKGVAAFIYNLNSAEIYTIDAGNPEYTVTIQGGGGAYTTPALSVPYTDGTNFTVLINNGTTTQASVRTLFETDPILKSLFIYIPSDLLAISLTDNPTVGFVTGDAMGYVNAEERSIENFNRVRSNSFQKGTPTQPVYRRVGDSEGIQTIEISPISIKYTKLYYYYRLPDLDSDTDTSYLPTELEDILLIDLQRRVYVYLKKQAEDAEQQAEYQKNIQGLEKNYQDKLALSVQNDKRIGQTVGA